MSRTKPIRTCVLDARHYWWKETGQRDHEILKMSKKPPPAVQLIIQEGRNHQVGCLKRSGLFSGINSPGPRSQDCPWIPSLEQKKSKPVAHLAGLNLKAWKQSLIALVRIPKMISPLFPPSVAFNRPVPIIWSKAELLCVKGVLMGIASILQGHPLETKVDQTFAAPF